MRLLYGIIFLVIVGLVAVVINYGTDTHPTNIPEQKVSAATLTTPEVTTSEAEVTTSEVTEKDCSCCAERMMRVKEMIRRARERKQAELKTKVDDANLNNTGK